MIDFGSIVFSRNTTNHQSLAWEKELVLRPVADPAAARRIESSINLYRDLISGVYECKVDEKEQMSFSAHAQRAVVGGVAIAEGEWGAHLQFRRPEHVKRAESDFVRVKYTTAGSAIMVVGDDVFVQKGPSITLTDHSRPWVVKTTRWRSSQFYLPHEAIGYDPSRHPPQIVIPANTPRGAVLVAFFQSAIRDMLSDRENAHYLAADAAALFRALLLDDATEAGRRAFHAARLAAMKQFLRRRLRDQTLGISHLMAAFGASRATIYRDFEPSGGVARFIAAERAKQIALDIIDQAPARGAVSAVSDDWGFATVQDFSRFFRRQTGLPPSDLVGLRLKK